MVNNCFVIFTYLIKTLFYKYFYKRIYITYYSKY